MAKTEGVSINQFLALAAAEKISALRTLDYLRTEASKGSRADFEAFLASVPDVEPMEDDKLDRIEPERPCFKNQRHTEDTRRSIERRKKYPYQ